MRLPKIVLHTMRGIGGAALIAAAGCGGGMAASQGDDKGGLQENVTVVSNDPAPLPQPEPQPQPQPITEPDPQPLNDLPPPCGRG